MKFAIKTVSGSSIDSKKMQSYGIRPDVVWTVYPRENELIHYKTLVSREEFFKKHFPSIGVTSEEDYWERLIEVQAKRQSRGEIELFEYDENSYRIGANLFAIEIQSLEDLIELSKKLGCEVSIKEDSVYVHDTRRKCEA